MNKPFNTYLHKDKDWYLVDKSQINVSPPKVGNSMIIHSCPKNDGRCSYWYNKDIISTSYEIGWCYYCRTGPSDEIRGLWLLHNFDRVFNS